jgi:hypothetical protein
MNTLFANVSDAQDAADIAHKAMPDWFNIYAVEKLDMPTGWRWFRFSTSPDDAPKGMVKLTGCVPSYKKNGKPDWKHPIVPAATRFVPLSDIHAHKVAVGQREGKCWSCWGCGQQWAGWSRDDGVRYRHCQECDGTGLPTEQGASHV